MRFKDKVIQNLKNGDSKEIIRFAWFPKRIGNQIVLWESYRTLYAWIETVYQIVIDGKQVAFTQGEWRVLSQQTVKA